MHLTMSNRSLCFHLKPNDHRSLHLMSKFDYELENFEVWGQKARVFEKRVNSPLHLHENVD